MVKVFPEHVWP